MPLHISVGVDGVITHAGPTLRKLTGASPLVGAQFLERFALIRPRSVISVDDLRCHVDRPLRLRFREGDGIAFRGTAVILGGGLLIDLSFGIDAVDAVRRFALTSDDFAATDLTIELLYLVEAKTAAFDESRKLNQRIQSARDAAVEQAVTDMLTGLRNRRAMDHEVAQLVRTGEAFALMHIDLDFFKAVNDSLGHAAGDHVLREVAGILLDESRRTDMVARVGGDEFAVILRDVIDTATLTGIAERVIARLGAPIPFADAEARVSASVGTTVSTLYARPDADRMLRDADAALYLSKRDGRSRSTLVTAGVLASGALTDVLGDPR